MQNKAIYFLTRKSFFLFLFFLCFQAEFFIITKASAADNTSVFISAIQIAGNDADDDFVEFYNPTCADFDLSGWKLKKRTKTGSESSIGTLKNIIPAKGYFLWENISGNLAANPDYSTKTYYLANDSSLALYDKDGALIDSVTCGNNPNPFEKTYLYPNNPAKSESLLRNISNNFSIILNYSPKNSTIINSAELALCPKKEISVDKNIKIVSPNLILNEILPYPISDGEEFIEIYNPEEKTADISDWILRDGSKTGKYIFPKNTLLQSASSLVIYKKDFKFALNNSGIESIALYDPAEKIISTVSYNNAKENISYNFDGKHWRWSKFITPGEKNVFNNLPEIKNKVSKKVFINSYADFSARGSDADNDNLKYTWNFGDGHKSYLKTTRHKYTKSGKYTVTLKVSDGSEDKIETFKITVKKFPKLAVSITRLSVNPIGKDTNAEFIAVKNNSKKKINLKNWSVATGNKTLLNHPIDADLFIHPGKEFAITRVHSKFTLNNKNSKIELRYPTGKVASKAQYDKQKGIVSEDEIYERTKLGWVWKKPLNPTIASADTTVLVATNIAPIPEIATTLATTEIIPIISQKETQRLAQETEIENNLGKFSQAENSKDKKSLKMTLLNFGLRIKTASASEIKSESAQHPFLSQTQTRKHWAVNFWEKMQQKINLFLNRAF